MFAFIIGGVVDVVVIGVGVVVFVGGDGGDYYVLIVHFCVVLL